MRRAAILAAALWPVIAFAQSNPGFQQGQVPTPGQWNSYFTGKVDTNNGTLTNPSIQGGAISGTSGSLSSLSVSGSSSLNGGGSLAGGFTGSLALSSVPNLSPALSLTQSQTFNTTAAGPAINIHGSYFGTVNSGLANWNAISCDIDRVTAGPVGGASCFFVGANFGGGSPSALSGGRNGFDVTHTMTGDIPTASGSGGFLVASAGFEEEDWWNGGFIGSEKGSSFGLNVSCRRRTAGTIGSFGYRGCNGAEMDVGIAHTALGKQGMTVVEWTDSNAKGWLADYAYGTTIQTSGTAPGFQMAYSVGNAFGNWPIRANDGILFGNYATVGLAGTPNALIGFDLRNINLGQFGYVQSGAAIDGSGNIGGLTTSGTVLQTQGTVQAQTAVVNTITVASGDGGGEFQGVPILTVSPPPLGGTTATATVATMGIRRVVSLIGNQGSGYVVGDVLTFSGGTCGTPPTATVGAVDPGTQSGHTAGAIIDFSSYSAGSCSVLPSDPITLTGGTGTGAKSTTTGWTIKTVTVSNPGSNYPAFPPPLVTTSVAARAVEALMNVTMTANVANLILNPNGGSVGGVPVYNLPGAKRATSASIGPVTAAPAGGALPSANEMFATPFKIDATSTLKTLSFDITSGNASAWNARMCVYADNGSGQPGSLIADSGTIAVGSGSLTGVQTSSTLNSGSGVSLAPGWYWSVLMADNASESLMSISQAGSLLISQMIGASSPTAALAGTFSTGWKVSQTFGACPNPFGTASLNAGTIPVVAEGW